MALPPHFLSNLILGQAGGSEFGTIGNSAEFTSWFRNKYNGYTLKKPVAYVKAAYNGGHASHKLEAEVHGYLVLCVGKIVYLAFMPGKKWVIEIPLGKIRKNLMYVESKGFTRLALTPRKRDKFLKTLENMNIDPESKKILQTLPSQAASISKQKYSKQDVNYFVTMVVNIVNAIKKRTLTVPYEDEWGLQKPKFFLGVSAKGLDEFIYEWAKIGLK